MRIRRIRQRTYLNVILTVNAVLLSALVWVQVAPRAVEASTANAQTRPRLGIPNAADQRQKTINELKSVNKSVQEMKQLLESGKVKVQVTNLDEIRIEGPDQGR